MKPYFSKSEAWVQFERLHLSGYYLVTLYDPMGDTHDKVRCDDYRNACEYRRAFVSIAKNWGK